MTTPVDTQTPVNTDTNTDVNLDRLMNGVLSTIISSMTQMEDKTREAKEKKHVRMSENCEHVTRSESDEESSSSGSSSDSESQECDERFEVFYELVRAHRDLIKAFTQLVESQ
jgi:NADH:ubiquinone oxidoreductase subunit C